MTRKPPLRIRNSPADDAHNANLLKRLDESRSRVQPVARAQAEPSAAATPRETRPTESAETAAVKKPAKPKSEKPAPERKAEAHQAGLDRKRVTIRVRDIGKFGKEIHHFAEAQSQEVKYCVDFIAARARKAFAQDASEVQSHARKLATLIDHDERGGDLVTRAAVSVKVSDLVSWRKHAKDTFGVIPEAKLVELVFVEELRRQLAIAKTELG